MKTIQETFLELDWEDAAQARQARDGRVAELQAQGYECHCENLYTVYGHRVFLVNAVPAEALPTVAPKATEKRREVRSPRRISGWETK